VSAPSVCLVELALKSFGDQTGPVIVVNVAGVPRELAQLGLARLSAI
jgi:hypothetical protein